MTPLERAKAKAKEPPVCKECDKAERIKNILYCGVSGKIILPMFEDISVCRGKRLESEVENEYD